MLLSFMEKKVTKEARKGKKDYNSSGGTFLKRKWKEKLKMNRQLNKNVI